jgi:methyltransferase (TIGR00027 family)
MSRTDTDSWDLASSVGATATMVAAARALASREPDPLIDDPFAADLVRAVGLDFFTRLVDGEIPLSNLEGDGPRFMANWIAVRTRFFDDFFVNAGAAGIRQAVILAAGLDSRAYRLPWAAGTTVFEVDQPKVIEFKTTTMSVIGATPKADRRTVSVDLREDWPAALRRSGFDDSQPTAWSAEGLLAYLPPEAQDRLFDNITALSVPGSQLATEYHLDGGAAMSERAKTMRDHWREHGFDVDLSELFYPGERSHVVDYLSGHGWTVSARNRPELFADYGCDYPNLDALAPMRNSLAVIATRK